MELPKSWGVGHPRPNSGCLDTRDTYSGYWLRL